MILISRNTGTSYVELLNLPYCEIDRIYHALEWVVEQENEARQEAINKAESEAKRRGQR